MPISAPIVRCYNPQEYVQPTIIDADGGKLLSFNVQFNFYQTATGGALFVNGGNAGVCEITLPDDAKMSGQGQWSLAGGKEDPAGTFGKITVSSSIHYTSGMNQVVRFDVGPGGVGQPSTVILEFKIRYK